MLKTLPFQLHCVREDTLCSSHSRLVRTLSLLLSTRPSTISIDLQIKFRCLLYLHVYLSLAINEKLTTSLIVSRQYSSFKSANQR